ncbi:MAG: LacI family DNA-binding transcriptional regulator [Armatimonadetes bacterium]|nr:LacI family DNA-binding transcriptional regulator [Candidatus Hippobium faecium]
MTKTEKLIRSIKIKYLTGECRLPTQRVLAEEFDVSSATLVKAFDILEAEGYIRRCPGSGTFSVPKPEERYIGLIGLSPEYEIMGSYIKGVDRACKRYGFSLKVGDVNTDWDCVKEREAVLKLSAECEGIILIPKPRTAKEMKDEYLNRELFDYPIVLLDTGVPKIRRLQVTYNYKKEAYDLTRYFIDAGYRNIYMFYDLEANRRFSPHYFRCLGFAEALSEAGIEAESYFIRNMGDTQRVKTFLGEKKADVIICSDDMEAKALCDFLRLENIKNVKLAGFDNLSAVSDYPIVTTDIDETAQADFAVDALLRLISGEYDNSYIFIVNSKVVVR